MKTLILFGSPRENGNTAFLTERLAENIGGEIMRIDCYSTDIAPCIDCRACREGLFCAVDDGMQRVYEFLRGCDNVIIASPIYFGTLTGPLLSVAGRFQMYCSAAIFRGEREVLSPKRGAVILTGGGSGGSERAYAAACDILRSVGCRGEVPLVLSGSTDRVNADDDREAVEAADRTAEEMKTSRTR